MLDLIPPVPLEKTEEFYRYVQRTGGRIWSIRVGRAIAGAVGILPGDPETKLGHSASLFIYLSKRYWGRGIGTEALQAALAEAKQAGLERIEVLAVESNARARGSSRRTDSRRRDYSGRPSRPGRSTRTWS